MESTPGRISPLALIETYAAGLRAVPELRHAGDPILRRRCVEVAAQDEADLTFRRLKDALERYRAATGMGRGLAAPQIGIPLRAFVTFLDGWRYYVNPRLKTSVDGRKVLYRESCLSCGPMSADVSRFERVICTWDSERGRHHEEELSGIAARVFLHELGHVDGALFPDVAERGSISLRTEDPLLEQFRPAP